MPLPGRAESCALFTRRFLEEVDLPSDAVVAGYYPLKGEMDVRPLLSALYKKGHVCALPCLVDQKSPLVFRMWHDSMPLLKGAYDIPEPDPAHAAIVLPDIVIVPLVAFDKTGNRLGYGAGFYDRTLQALREPTAVGAGFEIQRCDSIPAEPHDIRMDIIVTEKNVYKFWRD